MRWREMLWAEAAALLGGIGGAVLALPLVTWGAMQSFTTPPPYGLDEDAFMFGVSTAAVAIVVAASAVACAIVLRRRGIARGRATAAALSGLVAVIYLGAAYSSTTSLQSDLFPWAAALAAISPMLARALVARTDAPPDPDPSDGT